MNLNATLFAQLVVFFILGWFTMRFVWPPIMKALDERSSKIAEGLAAADKAKADLHLAERRVVDELRKARATANDTRVVAERRGAQIIEEARGEASQIVTAARQTAENEAELAARRAKEELREQVAALALAGAERILRREIDAKSHGELLGRLKAEL